MAQRRMISNSLSTSKKLSRVSNFEALLFTWLIPHCDDFGHMDGQAELVKAIVIPLRPETVTDVEKALKSLEKIELIKRYKVQEDDYIEIAKWNDHQTFKNDRKRIEKFPRIPDGIQLEPSGIQMDFEQNQSGKQYNTKETNIKEKNTIQVPFDEFWNIYPKHTGKKKANELWNKLSLENQQKAILDVPKRMVDRKWIGGYIKDPERYIRNEQWNDDIVPETIYPKKEISVDRFATKK